MRIRIASSMLDTKIFPSPPSDRLDGLFNHVIAEHNLDLHLGQKIHDVFRPAVKLGVPLLPAKTLGFRNRDALQPDFLQRLLHLVEFEWLDDGLDFFHSPRPWIARGALRPTDRRGRVSRSCAKEPETRKKLPSQQVERGFGYFDSARRRRGAQQMGKLMNLWAKPVRPISASSPAPGSGSELPPC